MDALNERSLGRGTSAARRCMNSSGDITICVVPYLDRGLQGEHPVSGPVECQALRP